MNLPRAWAQQPTNVATVFRTLGTHQLANILNIPINNRPHNARNDSAGNQIIQYWAGYYLDELCQFLSNNPRIKVTTSVRGNNWGNEKIPVCILKEKDTCSSDRGGEVKEAVTAIKRGSLDEAVISWFLG